MALWTGPGRRVIEWSWEHPIFGIELCGALSDMDWGAWKLICRPFVPKLTPTLLDSLPAKTLELLVALHRERRLADVDIVWKQRLQSWVNTRFDDWDDNEENVRTFSNLISLYNHLTALVEPPVE